MFVNQMFRNLLQIFLLFIILVSIGCSASRNSALDSRELRILTYNIRHANPPAFSDSIDIPAIVRLIASQDPHLVALQEIDVNTERSGRGNQAEMIARELGMYWYFGKAIDFNGGEYGTAILSRFPISDTVVYPLPGLGGKGAEQRVLTAAKVLLPWGGLLVFGSTHLDHMGDPDSRMLQVREILRISENENLPMIVAGDFNAPPYSEEMRLLESRFSLSCTECPNTYPAKDPDKSIDHIAFWHPARAFKTLSHWVVEEDRASDHRSVMAVLREVITVKH